MRIVVTGATGFIGANLRIRLRELGLGEVIGMTHDTPQEELQAAATGADVVYHLAGVNRPKSDDEFVSGNVGFTERLCAALATARRTIPVVYASSTQAAQDNAYGRSKRGAEEVLRRYGRESSSPVHVFRLCNVFGKWAKPNYNSAVATFCHNVARGLPIAVHDPAAPLRLLYVDDVVDAFLPLLTAAEAAGEFAEAGPVYETTIGEVAEAIRSFAESRTSLTMPRVGSGLVRALYATYVSYLPPSCFAYSVPCHNDPRGSFAEVLKTPDCGQFSYFTAYPGVTRGEHYHHTKSEKFVVIRGTARFRFRHVETGELHHITVQGGEGQVVEAIPGWVHDITNIGNDELLVLLWANEIFDRSRPDTVAMKVVA